MDFPSSDGHFKRSSASTASALGISSQTVEFNSSLPYVFLPVNKHQKLAHNAKRLSGAQASSRGV